MKEDEGGDPNEYRWDVPEEDTIDDVNEQPGLLSGESVIPPVALTGPNVGGTSMGMGDTGAGAVGGLPPAIAPVITDEGRVESGVLVNPFTPADPDNRKPFDAEASAVSDLAARLEAEMASDGRFSGLDISITEEDGVVHLNGSVPSATLADDLETAVRRFPGVRDVENHLVV